MKPKGNESDLEKIGKNFIKGINRGFILSQAGTASQPHNEGDFAIFTDAAETVVDPFLFRGGGCDPLTIPWVSIRKGEVKKVDPVESGAPGASLYVPFKLGPGEEKTIRVMMVWYVPLSDLRHGGDATEDVKCDPASGCCGTSAELGMTVSDAGYTSGKYKPWYSSRFKTILEVATFWTTN